MEPWLEFLHHTEQTFSPELPQYHAEGPDKWDPVRMFIWSTSDGPDSDDAEDFVRLSRALSATARAWTLGAALAATDGPLPFMDVVGFGVAVFGTGLAWWEFIVEW